MFLHLNLIFWILLYTPGLWSLVGFTPAIPTVLSYGTLFLLITIQISRNITRGIKFSRRFRVLAAFFVFSSVISYFYNEENAYGFIFFLCYTMGSYLYFSILLNETSELLFKRIISCICILFILQMITVVIKGVVLGQTEFGAIGLLSTNEGSLSTIFPSLVIAIVMPYAISRQKWKYVLPVFLALLFSIIGGKRATIVVLPLLFFASYLLHLKAIGKLSFFNLKPLFYTLTVTALSLYFIVRLIPTLNPERKVWGHVDVRYVIAYIDQYTDSTRKPFEEMRRKAGLVYFLSYLAIQDDPMLFLFGDGAGKLVNIESIKGYPSDMLSMYGVRYGGRMGLIWLYLQVGLLGTLSYILLLLCLVVHVMRHSTLKRELHSSFILCFMVVIFDMVIYSSSFMVFGAINVLFFFLAALVFKDIANSNFLPRVLPGYLK
jgi:hypothetical protein